MLGNNCLFYFLRDKKLHIVVEFVDLYGAAQAALAWEKLETPTPQTPTPEEFSHSIFLPVTLR